MAHGQRAPDSRGEWFELSVGHVEAVLVLGDDEMPEPAVVCAVGSLSRARIRLAGATEQKEFLEELEIVSLTGTVSASGCHLHVSVADSAGRVFGGLLLEGCEVRTTVELIISRFGKFEFRRELDSETGFHELVVIDSSPDD